MQARPRHHIRGQAPPLTQIWARAISLQQNTCQEDPSRPHHYSNPSRDQHHMATLPQWHSTMHRSEGLRRRVTTTPCSLPLLTLQDCNLYFSASVSPSLWPLSLSLYLSIYLSISLSLSIYLYIWGETSTGGHFVSNISKFPQLTVNIGQEKSQPKRWGLFMSPSFFFFLLFALFCLSCPSLPVLFDILKPKKCPPDEVLGYYLSHSLSFRCQGDHASSTHWFRSVSISAALACSVTRRSMSVFKVSLVTLYFFLSFYLTLRYIAPSLHLFWFLVGWSVLKVLMSSFLLCILLLIHSTVSLAFCHPSSQV